MKFIFGMSALISVVAFAWHLTDRLQDDTLAMLMGGGLVGLVAIVVLFVVLRLLHGDRANERRYRGQANAQAQPQPPVIVIQAAPQPHQIESTGTYGRLSQTRQQPHPSVYFGAPQGRSVESVDPVQKQLTARQRRQIAERGW